MGIMTTDKSSVLVGAAQPRRIGNLPSAKLTRAASRRQDPADRRPNLLIFLPNSDELSRK
jgi:hypothetical protein